MSDYEVVWRPLPGSQQIALASPCDHTLYHGTRGPGKSCIQLMRFRRLVGLGYGAFWRGLIVDREFKHLSDLVTQSKKFFSLFGDGAKFLESSSAYKWVWPTGEELLFRHIKKVAEYEKFHGHEYPFLAFNELTKFPTSEIYDLLTSTNRSGFDPIVHSPNNILKGEFNDANLLLYGAIKGHDGVARIYNTENGKPLEPIPLEVFSTTNPSGPGHSWVKKRFITSIAPGTVLRKQIKVFDPKTEKEIEIEKTQCAIFGSYRENKYLDPKYIAQLDMLTANNPNLRKAWVEGDWNFTAGGAIDDLWDSKVHILPRFTIPKNWYLNRSFDWGSSHPFSVCWWAECNGEEVTVGDRTYGFPRGTLIMIAEWYGCQKVNGELDIGSNKGIKLSAADIAEGIKNREIGLLESKWIGVRPEPGPADNQISDVRERDVETIKEKMDREGVQWIKSDKSSGSRINGLQLLRDRLESSLRGEDKGFYIMQNCSAAIEILPSLPRDPEKPDDVCTDAEDHIYDAARYRILQDAHRFAKSIKTNWVT